ncbi:MAG TPA: hypothetical protein PLQ57_09060 [Saprospiraceae bacterium]|nr:hypothetical protein [Saprospiraceae bacterium]
MERKIIEDSNWDYQLTEDESGKLYFEVICGTVAIYTIAFELNVHEIDAWRKEGPSALRTLSYRVRDYPEEYLQRREKE